MKRYRAKKRAVAKAPTVPKQPKVKAIAKQEKERDPTRFSFSGRNEWRHKYLASMKLLGFTYDSRCTALTKYVLVGTQHDSGKPLEKHFNMRQVPGRVFIDVS